MCPLNIRLGPPPAPAQRAEHVRAARPRPPARRPAAPARRASRAISSAIACSRAGEARGADRLARRRRRGAPRRSRAPAHQRTCGQHRARRRGRICSSRSVAPELEHDVACSRPRGTPRSRRCSRRACRRSACSGRAASRSPPPSRRAARRAPSPRRPARAPSISIPASSSSVSAEPLDVLELVGEVHAGDLAGAVAAGVAVGGVDRGDDRAAEVDLGRVAPGPRRAARRGSRACSGRRRGS